ncbi:hypothetical protein [Arthrobacter sp. STN4]|uniref:hypothetical protein n=1 Tax=Arthrobacter sp. STN4 TaxID=2923276 RepID=UPI002119B9A3|nr:hypothetical protein [Arthrobacter sp. STN4]MCQ9163975.1 hypothetical protein [Arthrobacter sp. STN4]
MPLEDAGGGAHAVLEQNAEAAKARLVRAGYAVNQIKLNYEHASAEIFVAGKTLSPTAKSAAQSAANGTTINFRTASRTTADAVIQQGRIDADSNTLAKRGIKVSTTGLLEDGATILVRLIDGTPAQADYILKTYGSDGLKVQISPGPLPRES